MNLFEELQFFYNRKIAPGFKVKNNSLVLDIGSGDKPFWRADVFVDMLTLDNSQRASGTKTIHDLGTFVNANVEDLPFKDKSFDFSFSSHLLEHVEHPDRAIDEIVRVSKEGYLEMPNGVIETYQPFKSHLWFIFENEGKLIFVRKSKKLHEILKANNSIEIIKMKNPFIQLYWKKKIPYEIIDPYKKDEKFYPESETSNAKAANSNNYLALVKFIRKIMYVNKNIPANFYKK